jgi:hypothetical protein
MNDQLLEQLKTTSPELYQAMLDEVNKLREAEITLQREKELLEQKKNSSTKRKLFSQRGFAPQIWEKYGESLFKTLEDALHSFLIGNLQQEGFKDLPEYEQNLYCKRLLAYLSRKVESPDKIKKPTTTVKDVAVSIFD